MAKKRHNKPQQLRLPLPVEGPLPAAESARLLRQLRKQLKHDS